MRRRSIFCLIISFLAISCATSFARDYQHPAPIQLTHEAEEWADKTLRKMSLEEKIVQMFMIRAHVEFLNVLSPEYLELRYAIKRYNIGGLLLTVHAEGPFLYRNQPLEAASFTNRLQQEAKFPILFAADFERGLAMRFIGTTVFPHPMAFGAAGNPQYVSAFAQIVAQEARAIGVQWNFYPIADVNSNPANPIINTRSFGEDPKQVDEFATAYIKAARDAGMLTTAKHFPGHGDTDTDSHLALARVRSDRAHLETVELPPFVQAIAAGVDSVMVAHVSVPALDADPNRVASDSPAVIQELLENKMGFHGLVVPDAMDMNAFTRLFSAAGANANARAAVEVVKAGNDMLLLPADLDAAYTGLVAAVHNGEIPQARIDASVRKILIAKAEAGLNKARLVDMDELPKIIATPSHLAFGQLIADSAVTLVRDGGLLPLHATAKPAASSGTSAPGPTYQPLPEAGKQTVAVIFSDDVRTEAGRVFERELHARIPDANVIYVDPRIAAGMTAQVLQAVEQAKTVIAAVYLIPTAGRAPVMVKGTVQNALEMTDASGQLLHAMLQRAAARTIMISLGTPYLASSFPEVQNYLCTFSNATVSEVSAVKALLAELPIRGHLPVTIPNIAARGAGIEKPGLIPPVAPAAQPGGSNAQAK